MCSALTDSLTRIGIIGGGLIGGSLAESVKRHFPNTPLALADVSAKTRSEARSSGLFDGGVHSDPADLLCAGPVLIILAAPLLAYDKILRQLAPALEHSGGSDIYITDTGSVKYFSRERFRTHIPQMLGNIVGAHPIAGSELTGFSNRDPMLFEHSRTILCPGYSVHARSLSMIRGFWRKISGDTVNLRCEKHDMIYAAVSHLPQLVAFGLAELQKEYHNDEPLVSEQRAFTRLYKSSLPLWYEIFFCNAKALGSVFAAYAQALDHAVNAAGKHPPVYEGDVKETMLSASVHRRLHHPSARIADSAFGGCSAFEYSVTASLTHIGTFYRDYGGPAFADITIAAHAGIQHGIRSSEPELLRKQVKRMLHYCEMMLAASDSKQPGLLL